MNAQARRLLVLLLLVLAGQSLSGIFVQAYMWEQGGDLGALSRYNSASFSAMAVAFLLLGPLVKRGRSVVAVQVGLLLQVAFFLFVLLLGGKAGSYLELLGLVNGMGVGAFWVGQNMLNQQAAEPTHRSRFWGYVSASFSATALVGPLAGSRLVAGLGPGFGYQAVFGLAAFCYLAAGLLSSRLRMQPSDQPYRLWDGLWDSLPLRPWWRTLAAHVVSGFRDGILGFLPSILVYATTGDPRLMGNFAFLTSAVGLITNTLTGRYLPRRRWLAAMLIGGALQGVAALVMLLKLNFATLLLYSMVGALFGPLLGVPFMSHTFDVIGSGERDNQVERIVWREFFLVVGRLMGMFLLLILGRTLDQQATAMIVLAIVALAAVGPTLILGRTVGTLAGPSA